MGFFLFDLNLELFQGIIQNKSASGSRTLPFVTFDKKCTFLKIPNAALKYRYLIDIQSCFFTYKFEVN